MKIAHELHELREKKLKLFVLIRVIRGPLFFHTSPGEARIMRNYYDI